MKSRSRREARTVPTIRIRCGDIFFDEKIGAEKGSAGGGKSTSNGFVAIMRSLFGSGILLFCCE